MEDWTIDVVSRIAQLIIKKYGDVIPDDEDAELLAWRNLKNENEVLFQKLMHSEKLGDDLLAMEQGNIDMHVHNILKETHVSSEKSWYLRLAIAASVVIALTIAAYTYFARDKSAEAIAVQNNVSPGATGAVLVLGNGTTVTLDSIQRDGIIAVEGNTQIVKKGKRIVYLDAKTGQPAVATNTIITPKGREFQFALPDGSLVWLNAGSSISFSTRFNGPERRVRLTGEAYFEIARAYAPEAEMNGAQKKIPFIVTGGDPTRAQSWSVQVLGTHFNINAYEEENSVSTTLLEGSVKVRMQQNADGVVLKPGQQAGIKPGKGISVKEVDTDEVIAWKEGRFNFQDKSLKTILRYIARWYDVAVVYKTEIKDTYTINVSKKMPLADLLKFIESSGGVNLEVKGKTIFVNP